MFSSKKQLTSSRPPSTMTTKLRYVPFKSILTDPQVLLAVWGVFSVDLILLSSMTSTPTYLKRAFGLPIGTITYVFGAVALGCLIANVLCALIGKTKVFSFTYSLLSRQIEKKIQHDFC